MEQKPKKQRRAAAVARMVASGQMPPWRINGPTEEQEAALDEASAAQRAAFFAYYNHLCGVQSACRKAGKKGTLTGGGRSVEMRRAQIHLAAGLAVKLSDAERVLAKPFSYQTADRAAIDARRTALAVMREVDGGYGDPQAWAPAYSEADAQRSDELFDVFLSAEADLQAVDWELGWRGPGACPEPPLRPRRG